MTRVSDTLRRPTVLMCDLVGSSEMAERLGDEKLWEVLLAYQDLCGEVVHRYDGNIYKRLGDGLLVLFGVPRAHEDDAVRAVHTALGIVSAVGSLAQRVREEYRADLAVRVGVHTGEVVVGEVGGSLEVAGAAVHQADRLQGMAAINGVLVSAATAELLGEAFELQPRGQEDLKGFTVPMATFEVLGVRGAGVVPPVNGPVGMVGRTEERAIVHDVWESVSGTPAASHTLVITGDTGIGKSRLARFARDHAARSGGVPLEGECSPYHRDVPFHAIGRMLIRQLAMPLRTPRDEQVRRLSEQVSAAGLDPGRAVPLLAPILSLDVLPGDGFDSAAVSPGRKADETMQVIEEWWRRLASAEPRAIVIDDLHHADPSTLDLVERVVETGPPPGVLLIVTTRDDWPAQADNLTVLNLAPLDPEESRRLLAGLSRAGDSVVDDLVERSGGNPLFLRELAAARQVSASVPGGLRDLLMARLDQGDDLELAQLAAVIGVAFDEPLVAAVAGTDGTDLDDRLDRLAGAEIFERHHDHRGRRWRFSHELLRDVAYESLPSRSRRDLHSRLADVLLTETAGLGRMSQAAMHLERADRRQEAVETHVKAADISTNRGAFTEALHHLDRALELVDAFPAGERAERERVIRLRKAFVLVAKEGFGSAAAKAESDRAAELSPADSVLHTVGPQIVTFAAATIGGQRSMAEEIISGLEDELEGAAEADRLLVEAEVVSCRGLHEFGLGRFASARLSFERAIEAFYAAPRLGAPWQDWPMPTSVPVAAYAQLVPVYWVQGARSSARIAAERARQACVDLQPPMGAFNDAYALSYLGWICQLEGQSARAREVFLEMEHLSKEAGFPMWKSLATAHAAVASAHLEPSGEWASALTDLRQVAFENAGSSFQPYLLAAEAEVRLLRGEPGAALTLLDSAFELAEATTEYLYLAETYRLRARARDSLLARDDLEQAWETAVHQDAHVYALRAALDMAGLPPELRPAHVRSRIDQALESLAEPEAYPEAETARSLLSSSR